MARRTVVFIRRIRIDGPRRSQVRVGPRPALAYIILVALTMLVGLRLITQEDATAHPLTHGNWQSARQGAPKHGPRQLSDIDKRHL
jgi:hypothetical protein